MEIDYQTFESALKNWCESRYNEFQRYWPLNGGWEGWVQVDFAAYLQKIAPLVTLYREKKIYTNKRKRVDWLVNGDASNPQKKIAVEIKCLSGGILNAKNPIIELEKFIAGIKKDKNKLSQKNISIDNRGCQTAIVAINFALDAQDYLKSEGLERIYTTENGEVEIWAQLLYAWFQPDLANPTLTSSSSAAQFGSPGSFNSPGLFGSPLPGSSLSNPIDLTSGSSLLGSSASNPMEITE